MLSSHPFKPTSTCQTTGVQCIEARSALHYHDKEQPTHWDLNVYRGCAHGCTYCFARYSHDYIGGGDFFNHIVAKTNLAPILDKEFRKSTWLHEPVNLGGVSDSYQPVEATLKLLPPILEVFIKHSNPLLISTKSDLILRDKVLFARLSERTEVRVAASITTANDSLAQLLEPGATAPSHRFTMLRAMKEIGVKTYILLMPILPYLTDEPDQLEQIYQQAGRAGVEGIIAWPLNLRGKVKPAFIQFLREKFPALVAPYTGLFHGSSASPSYTSQMLEITAELGKKYGISKIPRFAPETKTAGRQTSLF